MTPERWQRIKEIFQGALGRAPEEISAFLDQTCRGDEALRQEVESLLSSSQKSGEFIDPALQAAASRFIYESRQFEIGEVVKDYKILKLLGKGGMGEVYEAYDQKLKRRVALKVLPALYAADRERLRRFRQEAEAASGLNHPNIVTLYEIFEVKNTHVIVEELVGGDMRQRLDRGPLELVRGLRIAEQIAKALGVAHEAKIVHRDIKPENIGIRPDDIVKVLDFGLAKLIEPQPAANVSDDSTRLRTTAGTVLGTAHYMSPEQARGKKVDHRTDIFSLGIVIYEMLVGQRPFNGESKTDVIDAILNSNPTPLSQLIAECPGELVRILNKALRKDREDRYQGIGDLYVDLVSLRRDIERKTQLEHSITPNATDAKPDRLVQKVAPQLINWLTLVVFFTMLGIGMLIGAFVVPNERTMNPKLVSVKRIIASSMDVSAPSTTTSSVSDSSMSIRSVLDAQPALSADGKLIAYSSNHSGSFEIYTRRLTQNSGENRLTNDGYENFQPALSPDGESIAYYSKKGGGIFVVPVNSGEKKRLTDFGSAPRWSNDGTKIVFQSDADTDLRSPSVGQSTIWICTVGPEGCKKGNKNLRQITRPGLPNGSHMNPVWSPDDQRIAFVNFTYTGQEIWSTSASAEKTNAVQLVPQPGESAQWAAPFRRVAYPVYSPDIQRHGLYFVSGTAIWWLPLLKSNDEPIGRPERVVETTGWGVSSLTVSLSENKTIIAYGVQNLTSNLWSVGLKDSGETIENPQRITRNQVNIRNTHPAFSNDGTRLAFVRGLGVMEGDIWVMRADGSEQKTRLAKGATPSWFPNDTEILYVSGSSVLANDIGLNNNTIFQEKGIIEYARVSPNGQQIVFTLREGEASNICIYDLAKKERRTVTSQIGYVGFPVWSPDGNWIAYQRNQGGNTDLMLVWINGGNPQTLIEGKGRNWPHSFSPDRDKIAFVSDRENGVWNVYWYSRTTHQTTKLTNYANLNSYARYPTWSPKDKGSQIVYEYAETTGSIWLAELK